jgi:hypothetical protein
VWLEASPRKGTTLVESATFIREIKTGETCAITRGYDPTHLTSPIGLAYESIRITLPSRTEKGCEFIHNSTRVVHRAPND